MEEMMDSSLFNTVYNPDVLTCLANLSNDEVFTPPEVVNQMLDMLPQELFENPDTTFLDPACKTGVFLREIAKRLIKGLEPQIPDLQDRVDHIFQKQLYGIAITDMTALLSRRSVYCSQNPAGEYSITKFDSFEGNIRFRNLKHTWNDGKCIYCGTSKNTILGDNERGESLEAHAYEWIHTHKPEEIFNMKFDVIIGNPPYQLNTAGNDNGALAKPIYHLFITQAIKLKPSYICMITPSRWFSGGWGLDNFRNDMISCNHLKEIHDYQNSSDCFTGVEIKGGVSYFLYNLDYNGPCHFVSHESNNAIKESSRFLKANGCDVLIRYNELMTIYQKVLSNGEFMPFSSIVSGRSPFGYETNTYGNDEKINADDYIYYERKGFKFMPRKTIKKNEELAEKYKLFLPKVSEEGKLPSKVLGKIVEGKPGMVCSGTYLLIGPFETEMEMKNAASYMSTKFFRALVSVNKISQDSYAKVYSTVPMLSFDKSWTDEELYHKYKLTDDEIKFIEEMILPMDGGNQ